MQRPKQLIAADGGMSTIEFAFVVPFLSILIIGIIDFGMGLWRQMQVGNAARAGAYYAHAHPWNSTAIQNAITNATSLTGVSATPAPAQVYGCSSSSGVTQVSGGTTCPDGNQAGPYITLGAQVSYSTILPWPGITNPMTLSATLLAPQYP